MATISINSNAKEEFIDITAQVQEIVDQRNFQNGLCHMMCKHTTAALTINENADPDVKSDLLMALAQIVDNSWRYKHAEGNSPAHLKSSLLGCQLSIPVREGRLVLGKWQGIMFAEFDGPRSARQVEITFYPGLD